jgi:hypothetical protein
MNFALFGVILHLLKLKKSLLFAFMTSSTVTGLEWPRGFQEVKVPRFLANGTGWW